MEDERQKPQNQIFFGGIFFIKNILEYADGRSLLEIPRNPNTVHPHELILPQDRKRNPHSHIDCFPGTPRA